MELEFRPVTAEDVAELVTWRYEPPYDVYDIDLPAEEALVYLSGPDIRCHGILDGDTLIGYCTFGADARVPGGDYSEPALDIGSAIRPDLTGIGRGVEHVAAIADFAEREVRAMSLRRRPVSTDAPAQGLRVSIAASNQRAVKVWLANGFTETQRFDAPEEILGSTEFIVLERPVAI